MTAALPRRSLLALLGIAPVAAAAAPGGTSGLARLGRLGAGAHDFSGLTYAEIVGMDIQAPGALSAALRASVPAVQEHARACLRADARAQAALAAVYPPEIAAYRSFAPHVRRRMYAELLAREAERLALQAYPPTPQASPGPGA